MLFLECFFFWFLVLCLGIAFDWKTVKRLHEGKYWYLALILVFGSTSLAIVSMAGMKAMALLN